MDFTCIDVHKKAELLSRLSHPFVPRLLDRGVLRLPSGEEHAFDTIGGHPQSSAKPSLGVSTSLALGLAHLPVDEHVLHVLRSGPRGST